MTKQIILILVFVATYATMSAQEGAAVANTPFEYPVAPDTCSTFDSRCNYVVARFWDKYDISRPITSESDFERAFRDWVSLFTMANRTVVMSSIRDFMFKASSNSANVEKIGTVAERALYGRDAEFWSDEVYVEFAKMIVENSRLSRATRDYYKKQIERINRTQEGGEFTFDFTDTEGHKQQMNDVKGKLIVLIFTDSSVDSSIDRVRLSTSPLANSLIESGELVVVNIEVCKGDREWRHAAEGYPSQWINGASETVAQLYDLRDLPVCFLLDESHKILQKNIPTDDLLKAFN